MEHKKLSEEEMNSFKNWLGDEGIRYFRHLKGLKGTVIPVLHTNGIPWAVHYREGM